MTYGSSRLHPLTIHINQTPEIMKAITRDEVVQDYQEILSNCKSVKAQKSLLTKESKRLEEYREDLLKAYARSPFDNWLHGERITYGHVRNNNISLRVVRELRIRLDN